MKFRQTSQFKKDIKKQIKKGKDPEKLTSLIKLLIHNDPLPQKYKDHALIGNWVGRRDCHIEPDWILIYKKTEEELLLERTGSHSDLF